MKTSQRRICYKVIEQMLLKIPKENRSIIKDLEWNYEDSTFKAPEQNIQWQRTMQTLEKHIPRPNKIWEWEILSIFTTKPVNKLKEEFKKSMHE